MDFCYFLAYNSLNLLEVLFPIPSVYYYYYANSNYVTVYGIFFGMQTKDLWHSLPYLSKVADIVYITYIYEACTDLAEEINWWSITFTFEC